jgi:phosphoglycerate dehydrogenase-like enzyme
MRAWVPYPEFAADLEALGVRAEVFTGDGTVPGPPAGVEFFVAPYMKPAETLSVTAGMPSLRVLQMLTAGYEDALAYLPDGATLCNARGVHDASTAELALTLILASLRGIPDFVRAQGERRWAHAERPALADRSVLIVGYGSIGVAIERRLLAFEATVTRVASRPRPADGVHGVAELPGLLPHADVVVIVTPLTPQTRHLVDADFIAAMRPEALLVNVARGGVVDTDALVAALHGGRIRAALDVTTPEPLPADHPLWSAPGVLISPHVGGDTSAFRPRARRLVREQVARFLDGRPLENVVAGPPAGVAARTP